MKGGRNVQRGFGAVIISAGTCFGPAPAAAIEVRVLAFGNGQIGAVVGFQSAGSDSSLNLSIQTGLRASSVFFNISGEPYTGGGKDCPHSPSLDLGGDGDVEWRFNGTGYGALGHQSLFSTGDTAFAAIFAVAGSNDSLAIRLPAGALVSDAAFDIRPSGYAGATVSMSVDVGADDIIDWSNSTLNSQVTISGAESLIATYLASAVPGAADAHGVRYVDVPVRLGCGSAATLTVTNLSVRYDVTLTTQNLALRLNALLPAAVGTANVSVAVKLSAESSGRLRIRDLFIQARSPLHAPDITDVSPPVSPELSIDENQSAAFSIRVQDIYGDPVTLRWFIDLAPVPGANGTDMVFQTNYTSSGRHGVMVTASNGLSDSSLNWWVNVQDVNLPPVIRSFSPTTASVGEGSPLTFSVDAYDPDGGVLGYTWRLDGREQLDRGTSYVYRPEVGNAGYHIVGLVVGDSGGRSTNISWNVLVRKTNVPPVIQSFSPAADPVINEGQALTFSITATDPNGDPLTYEWVLNGYSAGFGNYYNFSPDFSMAGSWALQALISDGSITVGHGWNITVADQNHAPLAIIDRPREGDEFLDTDRIVLSGRNSSDADRDPLTYRWYDGDALLSEGPGPNVTLQRGAHRLRLVVEDGKGGRGETAVNLTVRKVRISTNITLSTTTPREGDRIRIKVRIMNEGDTAVRELPVRLLVDGVPAADRYVARILPGDNVTEFFFWNAEAGKHDLTVGVGNESSILYVSVASGVPAMVYWMVFALVAAFGAVASLAVFFSVQWDRAISDGILDESKRRGKKKDLEKTRRQEERKPLGFLNIRLGFSPYKGKALEIKTTMPEELSPGDSIRESLSPVRKRYLAHLSGHSGTRHITQTGGSTPVTAGLFSARRAAGSAPPAVEEVDIPLAHPAPPGSETTPVAPAAPKPESAGPAKPVPAVESEHSTEDHPRKPKKRIKDLEDRIHELEQKGSDITGPRRFVSLAKSFWKGGNASKAEQYLDKAESKLEVLEKDALPAKAGPVCKKCGAAVDPDWIVCPECEAKLK